jgi:hypothetical protein
MSLTSSFYSFCGAGSSSTAGMPFTVFVPGNVVDEEIDRMSKELFN